MMGEKNKPWKKNREQKPSNAKFVGALKAMQRSSSSGEIEYRKFVSPLEREKRKTFL